MKAIIFISILLLSINPVHAKNINNQAKKYKKLGVHLPDTNIDQDIIDKAKDFFNYRRGIKVINKKRVAALKSNDKNLVTIKSSNVQNHENWKLFHYTILRNGEDKNGNPIKTKVKFYLYESKVDFPLSPKNKRPLLLMTPTIRGIKNGIYVNIEPKWAKHFASQGYHVILIQLGDSFLQLDRPIADLDSWVKEKIIDQRSVVDFVNSELNNKIDTNKIIAYGSSLGGIRSIITMALEKTRIALGVTVAAGGNFADLVVTTKQKEVVEYRDHRMVVEGFNKDFPTLEEFTGKEYKYISQKLKKHYKGLNPKNDIELDKIMNLEELYKYIKTRTKTEPLLFAKERNFSEDLLMYISLDDSKVRSKTQIELWEALGFPKYYKNGKVFKNHGPFILSVARSNLTQAQTWIEKRLFEKGLVDSTRDL